MTLLPILMLATTMAIFATMGYLKGSRWAFIALLILLLGFVAIKVVPDQIVMLLNGMVVGVMLTLKGGLGDLASGDLDALKATMESIEKPFTAENENFALLLVILGSVGMGLLLYAIMKTGKPSVFGLLLGLAYGYVLTAAVAPLVTDVPASTFPVPIIQPAERTTQQVEQAQSAWDQLIATLSSPQSIQILTLLIGVFIVLLLLLTVRKGAKSPGKKG